jgi:hypothetical protein
MKLVQYFILSTLMALTLIISSAAFAKDHQSGAFTLMDTVQVGAVTLTPGDYKVEWSGPADHLNIDFLRHGKTVATVEGSIKDLPHPSPYTAVVTKTEPDNTKKVQEIEFNHRSQALTIVG